MFDVPKLEIPKGPRFVVEVDAAAKLARVVDSMGAAGTLELPFEDFAGGRYDPQAQARESAEAIAVMFNTANAADWGKFKATSDYLAVMASGTARRLAAWKRTAAKLRRELAALLKSARTHAWLLKDARDRAKADARLELMADREFAAEVLRAMANLSASLAPRVATAAKSAQFVDVAGVDAAAKSFTGAGLPELAKRMIANPRVGDETKIRCACGEPWTARLQDVRPDRLEILEIHGGDVPESRVIGRELWAQFVTVAAAADGLTAGPELKSPTETKEPKETKSGA